MSTDFLETYKAALDGLRKEQRELQARLDQINAILGNEGGNGAPTIKRKPGRRLGQSVAVTPKAKKASSGGRMKGPERKANAEKVEGALSATPKTANQIADETGIDKFFVSNHLKRLAAAKKAKKALGTKAEGQKGATPFVYSAK